MIWREKPSLEDANKVGENTLVSHLGIEVTEIGEDYMTATMPVDERTVQPLRLLHGGASVALAESIGSMASYMVIDFPQQYALGLEINANHIKSAKSGKVTGTVRPVHLGRKTHVWNIEITNEEKQLVCISRLTMAILEKDQGKMPTDCMD